MKIRGLPIKSIWHYIVKPFTSLLVGYGAMLYALLMGGILGRIPYDEATFILLMGFTLCWDIDMEDILWDLGDEMESVIKEAEKEIEKIKRGEDH